MADNSARVPRGNPTGGEFARRDRTASDVGLDCVALGNGGAISEDLTNARVELGRERDADRLELDHADALEIQAEIAVRSARRAAESTALSGAVGRARMREYQEAIRAHEDAGEYAAELRNREWPVRPGSQMFTSGIVQELTRAGAAAAVPGQPGISEEKLREPEVQALMRAAVDAAIEAQSSGRAPRWRDQGPTPMTNDEIVMMGGPW